MRLSNRTSRSFMFEDGLPTIFEENGKMGVKMGDGTRVITPIYNTIKELDMPTAQYMVALDGKYGVLEVNYNGEITTKLEIEYDLFQLLKYGEHYLVRKNNKYGIWHNHLFLPCEYDEIRVIGNNDFLICKNGKYGVYDWHICVPCEYDEIKYIEYELKKKFCELEYTSCENYMLLRQGDKYGLWSKETQLLPTIYDEVVPPTDEWGIKVKKDGVWGYFDKEHNFTTDLSKVPLEWENLNNVGDVITF